MPKKYVMFNQEQKQEYINFEKQNGDSLRRYFVRVRDKEDQYKKDIADMNVDELRDTILYLGIRREESRGHLISLFRGYINWAILNQKTKDVKKAIDKITPENTNSQYIIQQTMIGSPKHLDEVLRNILNYVDYENRSCRDSLIFWLLYCGVELEEISSLKKDDLNKTTKIITTKDGNIYKINDKVLDLWVKCSEIQYIERKNSRYGNEKNKRDNEYSKYLLVDSEYLFRPIMGDKKDHKDRCSIIALRNIISKIFKDEERNIPPRNINYSGKFYQIYLLEQEKGEVDAKIFADKFKISYNTNIDNSELLKKTRKWRNDYNNWKLAFGYV